MVAIGALSRIKRIASLPEIAYNISCGVYKAVTLTLSLSAMHLSRSENRKIMRSLENRQHMCKSGNGYHLIVQFEGWSTPIKEVTKWSTKMTDCKKPRKERFFVIIFCEILNQFKLNTEHIIALSGWRSFTLEALIQMLKWHESRSCRINWAIS